MHRDIFRLQLTNNRRLIENLPPWQNVIYFGYNVKFRILRAGTNGSACFRTSASSVVKCNIVRI